MPADTLPLVAAVDIIRLVGKDAYERARPYAKGGAVSALHWNPADGQLFSEVQGTGPRPYRCRIELIPAGKGFSRPTTGDCSCPMTFDCKHVAATLLASNTEHLRQDQDVPATLQATQAATRDQPAWKSALDALTGAPGATAADQTTAMGLQFELREQTPRSRDRWRGATARPATAASRGELRLGIRPAMQSAAGNWVKGNLTWGSFGYQVNRLNLNPEHHRVFSELLALQRAQRGTYLGQDAEWLYLDDFPSPLLWNVLDEARRLDIPFLSSKKGGTVTLGEHAAVSLDAVRDAPDSDLHLTALLTIDGHRHPPETAGAIADHGVYCYSFQPTLAITLAPTTDTLTDEHRRLLGHPGAVVIPSADVPEFLSDYFPTLRRRVSIASSDASVQLPELLPPTLVLTAQFAPKHTLKLQWHWQYETGRIPLDGAPGGGLSTGRGTAAADDPDRDPDTERELLAAAEQVLQRPLEPATTLKGIDAAEFADRSLPTLEALDGIRVDILGEKPDYRELTEPPKLTVSTVETDQRDWFDLGVIVTIKDKKIPFGPLFAALSRGKPKLLLTDGSYLSLKQPVFDQLRELLAEAETLDEWDTGVRISRYQASLWSDFEDLADETDEAVGWRSAVSGLRDLTSIDPTPLPATVNAELRPYQQEGFHWLAFLWQHGLGGILADDMGLGKTLQALALVAHARQVGGDIRPFLVVAPTSVVSNWVSEAGRFTPELTVAAITATEAKSRMSLADATRGADLVVTSYALFRLDFEKYQALGWAGLILDEAQFVKNRTARVHICARELSTPFKLAITGTPMENTLLELHALLAIVAPGLFPSASRFAEEYQRPIEGVGSPAQLAKLRRRIRPLMMRRTKELVASDLPAKQEQVLPIDLEPRHRKLYDTFLQRERQKLLGLIDDLDKNRFIVFRSLTLLRMLSLDASLIDEKYASVPSSKLDALFEQLEDVLAEGHRALIFSQFTSFLGKAAARFEAQGIPYAYLDGSTTRRAEVINGFKDGAAPVFLISLKAGGFGLNLTEADYVFLLDPWWNPATEAQAVDRTHRIGQTQNVMVYRMVATGTIEEKVMALKERKARLFDSVMDDDATFSSTLTADDIRALLEP
ncbi:DEAD/DEAH box helicase [Salinibacterium sp. ZJ450]|uniref:DEAD/DEAH box helicase n=1 Tax=Salinibacterium sp. ZJ450 TaxID=2708338 RepID=UPI0014233C54|nr:DEAD/DEAH box helicase [Salinibacterium sp. ZJ450]